MSHYFFLRGVLIGVAVAAPVGPIGLLCIRRTLAEGRASGFVSGLGAATADGFYGAVAAFGLTAVSNALAARQAALSAVGGIFLCALGIKTFMARVGERSTYAQKVGWAKAYLSTLFLTLTNPTTILSFAAIFAGFGLAGSGRMGSVAMVGGVFLGSSLWWLILSGLMSVFREKVGPRELAWVNRASGAILLIFGLLSLGRLID